MAVQIAGANQPELSVDHYIGESLFPNSSGETQALLPLSPASLSSGRRRCASATERPWSTSWRGTRSPWRGCPLPEFTDLTVQNGQASSS